MGRFAFKTPERQALSVMKSMDKAGALRSIRTGNNYHDSLVQVARSEFCQQQRMELRDMTPKDAVHYLERRGQEVLQSTLNTERQAIEKMMHCVSGKLDPSEKLPVIKSELAQALLSRAYTQGQVEAVIGAQRENNALSTAIASVAGLRAHELLTIRPKAEQPPDVRPALPSKFQGREGLPYTVVGKGGLIREVAIPAHLAEKLEAHRLASPQHYNDRGIHYQQHYNINGGNRWSSSFTTASNRSLGWSNGAHGLRHSYAQERMRELQVNHGYNRDTALETVSQEMGHFRPEITEVYLR